MERRAALFALVHADQYAWFADMLAGECRDQWTQLGCQTMTLGHDGGHGARFHRNDQIQVAELVHVSTGERARSGYTDDTWVSLQARQSALEK